MLYLCLASMSAHVQVFNIKCTTVVIKRCAFLCNRPVCYSKDCPSRTVFRDQPKTFPKLDPEHLQRYSPVFSSLRKYSAETNLNTNIWIEFSKIVFQRYFSKTVRQDNIQKRSLSSRYPKNRIPRRQILRPRKYLERCQYSKCQLFKVHHWVTTLIARAGLGAIYWASVSANWWTKINLCRPILSQRWSG